MIKNWWLDIMNLHEYLLIRRGTELDEVSLGYRTVHLFLPEEIETAQLGYSIGESGESFVGTDEGDWKGEWLVIAYEDLTGDPIFVDLEKKELPTYTAAHGTGTWSPILIASSYNGFVNALREIDLIGENRRNPVQLEQNFIPDAEQASLLDRVAELTGRASLEFWESWLEV